VEAVRRSASADVGAGASAGIGDIGRGVNANPHRTAWLRQRRHRTAAEPAWLRVGLGAAWIAGVAAIGFVARPVWAEWTNADAIVRADHWEFLVSRVGLAVVAWGAIGMFDAVVRSEDRPVLDRLPVDGGAVVAATLERVIRERIPWLLSLLAVGIPCLGSRAAPDYLIASIALGGLVALAVAGGALTHLLAADVADRPGWAPVLDAIRGRNPREQAAFLYAPGVLFAVAGALAYASGAGLHLAVRGDGRGWIWILLPYLLAVACARAAIHAGQRQWIRAGIVRAEIDARYAAAEQTDDARAVYLDWMVRWFPRGVRPYLLRDLRQGWRSKRIYITGPWFGGVLAALVGWSAKPGAVDHAAAVIAVGAAVGGSAVLWLERGQPSFLRRWWPGGAAAGVARLVVGAAWLQPLVALPVFAVALRHDLGSAVFLAVVGSAASVGAASWAAVCARWPREGIWVYALVASVAAFGAVGQWFGGAT
jgi:hypothetical protein